MARMSRMVGAVVGSMALAAIPTAKGEAVPETEPNNTFPGQNATVGIQFDGVLCPTCAPLPPPNLPNFPDSIDFFRYTGLTTGDSFDLTFDPNDTVGGHTLEAGLYTDATTIIDSIASSGAVVHLLGTVPAGGVLTFGIREGTATDFESYSIRLTTARTVSEPATIVLLATGLTAAGLGAARRRKR